MTVLDPITPEAPAHVLRPARARCRVVTGIPRLASRPFIPVIYPAGHTDELIIVEAVTEKRLAAVRGAVVDKPTWMLNGVGSMGFGCSTFNDALDYFQVPGTVVDGAGVMRLVGREMHWYRDGVLRWGGPPITGRVSLNGTAQFSCMDGGWYVARKFFGAAERRDRLNGTGSMDAPGLPGWATTGVTKTRDLMDKARGVSSMKLTGNGVAQASVILQAAPGVGQELAQHVTAVIKAPVGTPVGTVLMSLTVADLDGTVRDVGTVATTDDTVLGSWVRFDTYAMVPPHASHRIITALWSEGSHGATGFDDVKVYENQKSGYGSSAKDLTLHGVKAMDHIDHGYGQGNGFGIKAVALTPSGVAEPMSEEHRNHKQVTDFFTQYTERSDGWDWRWNARLRRIEFAKSIGVAHTEVSLHGRSVSAGGFVSDETEISSKIVVPGDGDGTDRPEGGYTDTSRTAGMVLDYFHQPPAGTALSALDPMAEQKWDEKSQPQYSFDALSISDDYLGIVNPGDRISGSLASGKFRLPLDTPVRTGQVALNIEAGQLELT